MTLNFPPQARAKSLEVRQRKAALKKAQEQSGQRAKFRGAASTEEALAQKLAEMKAIKERDAHERPLAGFMRGERVTKGLSTGKRREVRAVQADAIRARVEQMLKESATGSDYAKTAELAGKLAKAKKLSRTTLERAEATPKEVHTEPPVPVSTVKRSKKSTGKLAPVHPGGKLPTERRRAIRAAQAEAIKEKLDAALAGMIKQKKPDLEAVAHLGKKIRQAERIARRAKDRAEGESSQMIRNRLFVNPFTGMVVNVNPEGCNQHTGPDCRAPNIHGTARKILKADAKKATAEALAAERDAGNRSYTAEKALLMGRKKGRPARKLWTIPPTTTATMREHERGAEGWDYTAEKFFKDKPDYDVVKKMADAHRKAAEIYRRLHLGDR